MAEPSIPRKLFDLAAPVIGLNVLSVLALAVDTAMCGRLPNAGAALEALGFATQVVFIVMVAMIGLMVGAVANVARAHGAGDESRVNHVLQQSVQLTLVVSVLVALVGNLGARWILILLGAEGESLDLALDYLRPNLTFTVFYYLSMLLAAVLRGVGNTRLAFLVAIGVNALNVLFNYGLILGAYGLPALGVQGAAIGTVMAQACGVVAMVVLIRRGTVPGVFLPLGFARFDGELARSLFRVGWPAALDMIILNASFASIIGMLGRIDPVAVAAHGIGLRIQALAFVPGLSVSQATGAMVGNALGARDLGEARAVVRASLMLCVAIMSSLGLIIIAFAAPIVAIFDVAYGTPLMGFSVQWMELLGYGMPIVGVHIAFVGMLRGAGETNTSLNINLVGTLLQIPLSWVLGFPLGLGAWGVWLGFPLSFVLKASVGTWVYRRGRWAKLGTTV